ncbi:hypothetical protein KIN20_012616 [Parelaphostrongylus tenuis]|uniref:Uncharacterized protein n=1 Tax=Parelaphostrongylus tenuis TaxID=148309 RepID=A0AAD5MX75_PARTN|nr:hypothetical protein KIN20_012616 [Parelaphostrongylus tenuis]
MVRLLTAGFIEVAVLIISAVSGCGLMPPGQARTRSFTVSGFQLPVSMVYSVDPSVRIKAFGMATSKEAAKAFIERLVMHTLDQLRIQINYEPLECKEATLVTPLMKMVMGEKAKNPRCAIVGSTVIGKCTRVNGNMVECELGKMGENIEPVSNYTTVSGTLTTVNIIIANWSREMWQNVVNRAIRLLSSSPATLHFVTAFATVS